MIKIEEKLILFDDEMDKLRATGWEFQILYEDEEKGVYAVRVDIPPGVAKRV